MNMVKNLSALLLFSFSCASLAGTGFLKGEQTSGLNKICYYEGVSGTFSKTVGAATLCPLSADDGRGSLRIGDSSPQRQTPISNTGFLSGEQTSGLNKICYYDSARGTFTKTVGAAQLCPLNAKQ